MCSSIGTCLREASVLHGPVVPARVDADADQQAHGAAGSRRGEPAGGAGGLRHRRQAGHRGARQLGLGQGDQGGRARFRQLAALHRHRRSYPTLQQFTSETGIKVNYSEPIQDNNSFFAKEAPILQQGQSIGYDIIVVTNGIFLTDYMAKGWLTELDPTQLPNFAANAAPRVQARDFDPGNKFTIPWQSGFTGIGYNPKLTGREITSFNDLFDPAFKGKVGMFSENQDTGNLALLGIGVKPEKSTPADWQKAADKLKQQRDQGIVRKYYDQSYIDALSKGETALSMAWSGDIFQANLSAGNQDLKFVIPNEGGVIWTDNMCIPLGAAHPVDAITYMNWVYQPRIAATMAESIEYITPVPSAQTYIAQDAAAAKAAADKASLLELSTDPAILPSQDILAKTAYYRVLTTAETAQWNDIFNAVIIA